MRRLALYACMLAGCGAPAAEGVRPPAPEPLAVAEDPATAASAPALASSEPPPGTAESQRAREVARVLALVAEGRALGHRRDVASEAVSRARAVVQLREKTERDLPNSFLEAQGEMLRQLGLIPPDYDFIAGIYRIVGSQIAGYYDPDVDTMYLLDDLDATLQHETLVHELVHALQDQHFDLGKLLQYRPGDSDRLTAIHALAEGDATAATFAITLGPDVEVSERALRLSLAAGAALSEAGVETPRVLQAALIAPYVDGYGFVKTLRQRGDWPGVDRAWRSLPQTTEQLLHVDKYDAQEPALVLADPPLEGDGWRTLDADVLGEQGLRMVLEQWASPGEAKEAAAGWGGDRYRVAERRGAGRELAMLWHLRFDRESDAREAEAIVKKKLPKACTERGELGPIAWRRKGAALVFAAQRNEGGAQLRCADVQPRLGEML